MSLIQPGSLAQTVYNYNDRILFEKPVSAAEKTELAAFLADLQGLPGSYHELFAVQPEDEKNTARLYTGEPLNSNAALQHILGEEALSALLHINSQIPQAQEVVQKALSSMMAFTGMLKQQPPYFFCCGKCTAAVWRVLQKVDLPEANIFMQQGLKILRDMRLGDGKWQRFPFYYTLYALIGIPCSEEELIYAAPAVEKSLQYLHKDDIFHQRKRKIAEQVLSSIR
jgi:hypothetical protein